MSNSDNFFKLVSDFKQNIEWLNTVLLGNENSTIIIDGVEKPSIDKAVKDKLDPVEADLLAKYAAIEKQINDNWDALDSDIQQKWAAISAIVHGGRIVKETHADLVASGNPPVDVYLAEVWRDTIENNGLYGWTGTNWEKSQYDDLKHVKQYIDERVVLEDTEDRDLEWLFDVAGNIVRRTTQTGHLILPHINESVQDALHRLDKHATLSETYPEDDISATIDLLGNIVRKVSKDGIEITPLMHPVFPKNSKLISSNRDFFSNKSAELLNRLSFKKSVIPPPANLLLPNNYGIPDTFINAFTLHHPENITPLDTPYARDDIAVHPYVVEMPDNFLGYKYVMVISPYKTAHQENPVLFGSNDSDNWEMIRECPQPVIPAPIQYRGHSSDCSLSYDPVNGLLFVFNRFTNAELSPNRYYWNCRYTENGITWSDLQEVETTFPDKTNLSPTFLFNPNDMLWHRFYCLNSPYTWVHETSDNPFTGWEVKSESSNLGQVWHSEVKFMGDKYVALLNNRNEGQLYFAVSADGDNWTLGTPLVPDEEQHHYLYKGSFLPRFDGNNLTFKIYWSINNVNNPIGGKLLINNTNTVDIAGL